MEFLLEQYLSYYYNIDGAICNVTYYTDESKDYKQTTSINIWQVVAF